MPCTVYEKHGYGGGEGGRYSRVKEAFGMESVHCANSKKSVFPPKSLVRDKTKMRQSTLGQMVQSRRAAQSKCHCPSHTALQ